MVGIESPLEMIETKSLSELVRTKSPLETVGTESPLELVGTESPLELVRTESPLEMCSVLRVANRRVGQSDVLGEISLLTPRLPWRTLRFIIRCLRYHAHVTGDGRATSIADYKASRGFQSGLEKMGQVTYDFGYWVALERFWAKYPNSSVGEDPFA
ncbi:hypothetical protein GW17_00043585 [Ensete ventricosum]|nr:hypothetical protein GW17_00043585 [Ensete ventricosum]RZS04305.1 hypothetical protein BHM03_00034631 [Ensete ventricosum]